MKSHILALLVLLTPGWKSSAQSNALPTNPISAFAVATNVTEADVERLLSRIREHHEGFVSGSTRTILVLSDKRTESLMRNQVFQGFTFNLTADQVNHRMQSLAGKSLEFGGRDWVANNSFFAFLGSQASGFIDDSIVPDEEQMHPLSVYYEEPAQSWWQRVGKQSFAWGVQPQASPYAFVGFKVSEDGKTILYTHLRLYFLNNFSPDQKAEAIVNIPIVSGWSVTTGAAYSTKERSTQSQCTGIFRLDYALTRKGDTRFSIGYQPGADRWGQIALAKSI